MTEPMIIRVRVQAPLKTVRHALTDPAALRVWLAEHAEVALPGTFAFWGRSIPEGDAPHQRPLHADERTLRFAWLLDGEETTTEFTLEEDGDATIVAVSQTHFDFQDVITGKSIRGVLQTFWCCALANLAEHLEGRELTPRIDFTTTEMRARLTIGASPSDVFDSLTDSEAVTRWFGYPIEIEPYVGGRFAMGGLADNPDPAKVIELEPGRKLSVDWGDAGIGTWELEGSGGRTRLTLMQSGFDEARPPYAAWGGFLSGLAELRRYHEVPDWQPMFLP
ncbi:SRPBCC domain-containing protein [Nonomuraea sp. KC401]|uniref:SRPBCC domain-containing protein n=1 Tax=Nonomuraea longispora TaxID=1848320 RepID=A0A4R4NIR5_9ACTN|nr:MULTISPECIES: SRPBCC domain-containing protein [Nonomuraea]NBE96908.1 SRPBCC domain-containing protein [Nonomuraea sp. K271]TDC09211.1 SRPBCC domain-containing protein [Nonomuraea longispora]TLF83307.1 SRPBCC domain-containing protein [Nonomuraea sp. KC401]